MDTTSAVRIATRFVGLPLDQRRQILDKMIASGQSFRLLPIVRTRQSVTYIPLSYAQQRLLFLWQLEPNNSFYNVPMAVRLRGRLDERALRDALELLVERHETLRTRFVSNAGEFHQEILENSEITLDIVSFDTTLDDAALRDIIGREVAKPFDLLGGPLLRVKLFRLHESEYLLTLCMHHIVCDGVSGELLVQEFVQGYEAFASGRAIAIPELPIQYADYALWQRAWLEAGEGERQLAYWKAQLGDDQPILALPLDRKRPANPSYRGAQLCADIPQELADQLRTLARQGGHTLFMLVAAALAVVLSRYSGQSDIRIGAPNAGRNRVELQGLIGFFINTQVLRVQVDEHATFIQLLDQVKAAVVGAQSNQDLPFEQLVDALVPERNLGYNSLFQFKLNQNAGSSAPTQISRLGNLTVEEFPLGEGDARFDLAFDFTDTPTSIEASFTYATDLFESSTIVRMATSLRVLLEALVRTPDVRLLECCERVISRVDTKDQTFDTADFIALWRRGLRAGGDKCALCASEQSISYQELEQASNRLAHHLRKLGVGAGNTVALCQERSIDWVVSLLAVMKLGAVYLPLDNQQPVERLSALLRDSAAALLIHAPDEPRVTGIDECPKLAYQPEQWADCSVASVNIDIDPLQPAYLIYTSGSTGQPKGVVISHRALANYLQAVADRLMLPSDSEMALASTVAADLGHTVLFGALASGCTLHLLSREHAFDPDRFGDYMNAHRISVLKIAPSHLQGLLQAARPADVLPDHTLILGGEMPSWDLVEQIRRIKPDCRIINHYGPTETTVGTLTHAVAQRLADTRGVPVGLPLANTDARVLDAYLNPVPVRVAGELYIGGQGLAQGYLGRPGVTAEHFIPAEDGGRLYRAGDRARVSGEGLVEFIGRADDQVKIRGYRVEPGEVSLALQNLAGVREAAVLALPLESDLMRQQLVAYCVVESDISIEHLQRVLKDQLPEYLVPAHFVLLERLPLTANGKLDKRALPAPEATRKQYVAPVGEIEEKLAAIWADVLKLERVGTTDNFFELGGDSILSLQIIARAKRQGLSLTPKQLFEKQTIGQLAQVARKIEAKIASTQQAPVTGVLPLLPIQMHFFEQAIPQRHHWNQSILLKPHRALQTEPLRAALNALLNQHDALRLCFRQQADGQWQSEFKVGENSDILQLSVLSASDELYALGSEAQRSLDLGEGPLFRGVLVSLPHDEQRLMLIAHHLVVDGVSWRILLEDLQTAYQQFASGEPLHLPAKTNPLRQWSESLRVYAADEARLIELQNWLTNLDDAPHDLPRDNIEGEYTARQVASASTHLDAKQTGRLLKQAPAAYRTQINDLLLAALARVIARWTQQPSALIQLEGHGREYLFDDIDLTRTVGWFTTMFPVKLTPSDDLAGSIKKTKEQLRAVPHKGIGFGILRYLGNDAARRALAALPQPRITFNYLGQFDGSFAEESGALFSPAGESAGPDQDERAPLGNWLSINGQVYNGELNLEWTFSREMFNVETIQRLADNYTAELQAVIAHCADDAESGGVTASDFSLAQLTQVQLDALPIPARDIEDIYPLSPMQQGILFHTFYNRNGSDYINQMRVDVDALDVELFKQAWQSAVDRHEALRASFVISAERPLQVIRRRVDLPFVELDWCAQLNRTNSLESWAQEDRRRGFDLQRDVLLRLAVIRIGENRHHLIYTSHHILMDGWSNSQLLGEVLQTYAGKTAMHSVGRYRDYIAWLQVQDRFADEQYWRGQISAVEEPTRLAQSLNATHGDAVVSYGDYYQEFNSEQTQRLHTFARDLRVTVNTLMQAAWLLLLQCYTGQDTVAFGATVSGRPADLPGIEEQIGLFINTLPVISSPRPEQALGEWLQQLQAQNVALREHEHTPLYEIQRWAGWSGESLFDSLLVFENYPISEALQQGAPMGLVFDDIASREQTNYPLTLAIGLNETLSIHYSYARAYFTETGIKQIAEHLRNLLQAFVKNPQQRIGELFLLSEEELHRQLVEWNQTEAVYSGERCIHQLIEAQVGKSPDAVALIFGDEQLTYRQLNTRANQLAHHLRMLGVGPDMLVGIAVERSLEMVIGLLGILKAGGAYVPLDPEYPAERLAYMVEDSGITLLLTQTSLRDELPIPDATRTLCLDKASSYAADISNPCSSVYPENLAYVIYTSGSTGKPKGVAIAHRNTTALIHWSQQIYTQEHLSGVLASTSLCFDLSVWEFFVTLAGGGYCVVARHALELSSLAARDRVQLINTVPSAIEALHRAGNIPPSVQSINLAGEPLKQSLVDALYRNTSVQNVYDLYGPSEDTTYSTFTRRELGGTSNIGRPISNTESYLLDRGLAPAPLGGAAELYLAGQGITRGYHNRPSLTAERFIPDPYNTSEAGGGRLYRTGDLARYRPDGVIEYAGRIDHQVKIRGFRIELGEVETKLLSDSSVREAVVIAYDAAGGKQLAGYVVPAVETNPSNLFSEQETTRYEAQRDYIDALKAVLKSMLPDYMVPAHVVLLEQLPLTPSGKLDRKSLPIPDASALQQPYVAPCSELEQKIAAIWSEVLGVERVGLTDNFFELGGHSLLATQVVTRILERTGVDGILRTLFELPRLDKFTQALQQKLDQVEPLQTELAKSLAVLKRLTEEEVDELISSEKS